nr:HAMP domain-containing protein [Kibdelosporangium phytohabitans]
MLVLVFLLAGFVVLQLRTTDPGTVPDEVVESQQHLVESVARSVGASATQGVSDLSTVAVLPEAKPEQVLTQLQQSHPKWRGMALLDAATRKLVAAQGEPVPVEAVPDAVSEPTVTPVVRAAGDVRMLVVHPLANRPGWVLVASSSTGIPNTPLNGDLRQGLLLLATRTGEVIDTRGTSVKADDKPLQTLLDRAKTAAGGASGIVVGDPAPDTRQGQGVVAGREVAPVVAYAPVSTDTLSGTLGLAVLSVVHAPVGEPSSSWPGLTVAAALVFVGLLGFGLVRWAMVWPVRGLRADVLAVAGGNLKRKVRRSHASEVARIAHAVDHCRTELGGKKAKRRGPRGTWSVRIPVTLAALSLLGWSGWTTWTQGRVDVDVPQPVIANSRSQLGNTADAVRRSVNDGFVDLRAVTGLAGGKTPDALRSTVQQLAERHARYRSVYIVDKTGGLAVSAGRSPLRKAAEISGDGGVRLEDTTGRVPVLFAHAPLPDGQHRLVAEFDVDHIVTLLQRSPGQVRLVDAEMRTIVATDGFVAFQHIPDGHLRDSVTEALAGKPKATVHGAGTGRTVVASRAIEGHGVVSALRWTVVAEQPASELDLASNEVRRAALVAALIGVILALMLFAWHELVLVRPLRAAAKAADKLAEGDSRSVIFPTRQDQIGTIASCLEFCRQALVDGAGRLGAVRRPSGAATDATELIPVVPDTDEDRSPRRKAQV